MGCRPPEGGLRRPGYGAEERGYSGSRLRVHIPPPPPPYTLRGNTLPQPAGWLPKEGSIPGVPRGGRRGSPEPPAGGGGGRVGRGRESRIHIHPALPRVHSVPPVSLLWPAGHPLRIQYSLSTSRYEGRARRGWYSPEGRGGNTATGSPSTTVFRLTTLPPAPSPSRVQGLPLGPGPTSGLHGPIGGGLRPAGKVSPRPR